MKILKIVQRDTYIAVEAARPLFVPAAIIFVSSRSYRDPTRDGWIKEFIKTEMKFWAILGSRGCREKKSQLL